MIAAQVGVNALVEFAVAGIAHIECQVAAVIFGQLLLNDVGFDGHTEMVGLAGEVGGEVVILVLLERVVAQIAPEDRRHAEFVSLGKRLANLNDLAAALLRAEINRGANGRCAHVIGLLHRTDQILFGTVQQAYDMGAAAVGATIYFGSEQSGRQIVEISQAFAKAHELGMATVLWCYLRNNAFKKDKDYHLSADLIKQKLPENNGGYLALNMGDSSYGKFDKRIYTDLCSDHPIDLCRYQVANCYMGRAGLINSGGASGANDFEEAVATAVINKRAGGTGLISGRKAFQRPMKEGVQLLNTIQDVYLSPEVTIA